MLIMNLLVGTLIIIISLCITALIIWYNHFYMIAFGRGLPEALFHQRLITTIIQSAPLIFFIYLALIFPNSKSSHAKSKQIEKTWSPGKIAIAFVCVCIMWPLPAGFLMGVYFDMTQRGSVMTCQRMESDAHNTLAAVSSYFSNPDHSNLPSFDQLAEKEGLETTFPVKLEGDPTEEIIATVIDHNDECPKGKKYVASNLGIDEWQD